MSDDQKILITGVSGQVGRSLVKKLCKLGFDITGLDIKTMNSTGFNFLKADITDAKSLEPHRTVLKDIKIIIHLASLIEDNQNVVENTMSSIRLNVEGILNLLEYLPHVQYICFASTYMVYGIPQSNLVRETQSTNPSNIYGASKIITEKFLQVYATHKNITLCILRFMGIYGPETPLTDRAIPLFIDLISSGKNPVLYGTGKSRRNHVYIDDAINAILCALQVKQSGVFNIGGSDAPSNLELVKFVNNIMNKNIIPTFDTTKKEHSFILDISLARDKLGFYPMIGIHEGLKAQIDSLSKIKHEL